MRTGILIATAILMSPLTASAGAITVTTHITQSAAASSGSHDDAAGRALLKNVAGAQSEINRVLSDLRRAFEESQELRDARSGLRAAQINYQASCAAALQPLRQTPEYKQAAEQVFTLERKLAWGHFDDHMTDQQKADTSAALLKARRATSTMESQALAADPNVSKARFALIDANGQVVGLQRAFNQSIVLNSQFQEARSRLDAARSQISDSR